MLSAHKRTNPFVLAETDDEVLMDVCGNGKRGRWEENTPLRKRSYAQANVPHDSTTFTAKDLEKAREEGRAQALGKVRSLMAANEALRHALQEAVQERDKFAQDCKVLKAGVVTLNTRSTQLARELEVTQNHLREESDKTKQLESTIIAMHANWSLGGCRRDDHGGPDTNFDGDVF